MNILGVFPSCLFLKFSALACPLSHSPLYQTVAATCHPHHPLLDVPGVLRMIFSHFNSNTLRTTIAPVCLGWHLACQDRIIKHVAWDDARKEKELCKVAAGIPGAGRLLWHSHGTNMDTAMEQWTKLQAAQRQEYCRRQRHQDCSMKRPMLDSPLLRLELNGSIDVENCIPRIRKYLDFLTCLRLYRPATAPLTSSHCYGTVLAWKSSSSRVQLFKTAWRVDVAGRAGNQ